MRTLFVVVLALSLTGCAALSDHRPVSELSTEKLIDRLARVDNDAFEARPRVVQTIHYELRSDDPAIAMERLRRSAGPHDAMDELVNRGADVAHPDNDTRDIGAAWALVKYYPDALPAAVAQRLTLPEYDERKIADFLHDLSLYKDQDAVKQELHEFFKAATPVNRDGLLHELWTARQSEWLRELQPSLDPKGPVPFRGVSHGQTYYFVKSIQSIPSPVIDDAVWRCFVQNAGSHSDVIDGSDWVAQACVERLGKRGPHDAEFVAYFRRRKGELRVEEEQQTMQDRIDALAKK